MRKICVSLVIVTLLSACGQSWNDPYPAVEGGRNVLYTAFADRPKHLDPAKSYAEDEATFTAQIYEPAVLGQILCSLTEGIAKLLQADNLVGHRAEDG